MFVGSILENKDFENRIAITPEIAKKYNSLGLKVCLVKGYGKHLGIQDNEYQKVGVEIKASQNEVLNSSKAIIKVNCPSQNQISILYN